MRHQTHSDLEIILVNDGSTDGSGAICDRFAAIDSRFKVLHQANRGVSAARNTGLDIAAGQYIGFVDPDDYIALDFYETLLSALTEYDADIAVGRELLISENGEPLFITALFYRKDKTLYGDNHSVIVDGILNGPISCDSGDKLYKRVLWENARYPDDITVGEDIVTVTSVCAEASRAVYDPSAVYVYRQREGSALRGTMTRERFFENSRATELMRQKLIEKYPETASNAAGLKFLHDIVCAVSYDDTCKKTGKPRGESLLHLIFSERK